MIKPFLGKWVLIPDQSAYQLGQPPREGSYTLVEDQDKIKVIMDWVAADGQMNNLVYYAIPDGVDYPYLDSPAVDAMSMTLINPTRLDSAAKKNGALLNHAMRELIENGSVMKVTMVTYLPSGTFTNIAYYGRTE